MTVNLQSEQESDQPFYLTEKWFELLKETTEKEYTLVNLRAGQVSLPHTIENNTRFKITKLKSLANYYSPEFDIKLNSFEPIADIYDDSIKQFDVISLGPLSADNSAMIAERLSRQDFDVAVDYRTCNWFEDNIASKEQYWQKRPSRLKNTLHRKQKKADSDPEFRLHIYSNHSESELSKLLSDYHLVYNKSWKNKEPYPEFINAITMYESARGNLRLGIAYKGETPVAAQIWFRHRKTAYIFKLAYDEQYRTEGYGNIVTRALVDFSIESDGVSKIDFLTGNDTYKKDWMSSSRILFTVTAINKRTLKGKCLLIAKSAKRLLRKTKNQICG